MHRAGKNNLKTRLDTGYLSTGSIDEKLLGGNDPFVERIVKNGG